MPGNKAGVGAGAASPYVLWRRGVVATIREHATPEWIQKALDELYRRGVEEQDYRSLDLYLRYEAGVATPLPDPRDTETGLSPVDLSNNDNLAKALEAVHTGLVSENISVEMGKTLMSVLGTIQSINHNEELAKQWAIIKSLLEARKKGQ